MSRSLDAAMAGTLALGLCAAVACARAADAERPGPSLPPRPTTASSSNLVFGLQRPADSDLLVLRSGERVKGTIINPVLTLRAAYGLLAFDTTNLAGVALAQAQRGLDALASVNQDRFSGFLSDTHFRVRATNGTEITIRREKVLSILFHVRAGELAGRRRHQYAELKNGDAFTAQLLGTAFKLTTASGEVTINAGEVDSIKFSDSIETPVRVRLRNGRQLEGGWNAEDFDLELDIGPKLQLYQGYIDVLYGRPGYVPARAEAAPARTAAAMAEGMGPREAPGGRQVKDMVWIVPGEFTMGSPPEEAGRDLDEGPQTRVIITHGFYLGAHEVTQGEFKEVMGANPSTFTGDLKRPVEKVTWREALDFCGRLTQVESEASALPPGYAYRLPTEAEWEYACRAGTTTRFSHGEDPDTRRLGDYAWFGDNSDSTTHPVAEKQPNAWGLHDMHGNVLEWCLDAATSSLPGGTITDYHAAPGGSLRIARGGSWLYGPKSCRSANRDNYGEAGRYIDVGFRVVLAPAEK